MELKDLFQPQPSGTSSEPKDLWYGTRGPHDAKIVFVAESWGSEEARLKVPLVGESGKELDRMLALAGVKADEILFTNVIAAQPKGNETWRFFEPKATFTGARVGGLAPSLRVREGIHNLYRQILAHPRQVVIAAGNYALWALTQETGAKVLSKSNNRLIPKEEQTWAPSGIMTHRGSMTYASPRIELFPDGMKLDNWKGIKVLPIIHPAAILRAWYLRDVTIHDLKTRVPLALKNDWRRNPEPTFLAPPDYIQCVATLSHWLMLADGNTPLWLASDIETARTVITCLGFSDGPTFAMSIPFIRRTNEGGFDSWWNITQEAEIVRLIRLIFSHPNIHIYGQNFIYDTQYIQHYMAVTPKTDHDTMLAQNVMFPGTPKDLAYLASLYCQYYWFWKEDHKEWDMSGTIEDLLRYNCQDLVNTWETGESQRILLRHLGMEDQMKFKMETHELCLRMMNRGVLFDKRRRSQLSFELREALNRVENELLTIVPQDWIGPPGRRAKDKTPVFWFQSDKQTKAVLNDFLGFKVINNRKTGEPTSGKEAMMQYKLLYPEWTGLINRLRLAGSLDNTLNVLGMELDPDDRARCSYNPGGADTHRLSSSTNVFGRGTNLQNLTKGQEDE